MRGQFPKFMAQFSVGIIWYKRKYMVNANLHDDKNTAYDGKQHQKLYCDGGNKFAV